MLPNIFITSVWTLVVQDFLVYKEISPFLILYDADFY